MSDFPRGATLSYDTSVSLGVASVTFPALTAVAWVLTEIEAILLGPSGGFNQTFSSSPGTGGGKATITLPATGGLSWVITAIDAVLVNDGAVASNQLHTVSTTIANGPVGVLSTPAPVAGASAKDSWGWSGVVAGNLGAAVTIAFDSWVADLAESLNVSAFLSPNPSNTSNTITTTVLNGPVGKLLLSTPTSAAAAKDSWTWSGEIAAQPGQAVTVAFNNNAAGNVEVLNVKAYPI